MPFQPGNKLGVGNTYGRANKGKPSKVKGRTHPPDCPHCAAVRRRPERSEHGERPDCECHGRPMRWQVAPRLRNGGTWKCAVSAAESDRKRRLAKFGLDSASYEQLLSQQRGLCGICESPPGGRWNRLAVDHDHATGNVRGLLCMTCNTMLGRLERRWDATMEYLGR